MNQVSGLRFQVSGWLIAAALVLVCSFPVLADSKADSLKPLGNEAPAGVGGTASGPSTEQPATDAKLEQKYREELEERLAQERDSYAGSLRSLWLANGAVWGCLLAFIIMQALSAKKRSAELERLKAQREGQ